LDYKDSNKVGESHGDKCLDLYARKQKGWFAEKQEKTAEDYEFEKVKEECTFAPKINKPEELPQDE